MLIVAPAVAAIAFIFSSGLELDFCKLVYSTFVCIIIECTLISVHNEPSSVPFSLLLSGALAFTVVIIWLLTLRSIMVRKGPGSISPNEYVVGGFYVFLIEIIVTNVKMFLAMFHFKDGGESTMTSCCYPWELWKMWYMKNQPPVYIQRQETF